MHRIECLLSDAENIIQEIFKNFWNRSETFKVHGTVKTYILRATHIKYQDHYRNKDREARRRNKLLQHIDLPTTTEQPEESEKEEKIRRLYAAIKKLPTAFRLYMELRLQEKSIAEIAAETGVQPQTVNNMLSGGRKKLRALLST